MFKPDPAGLKFGPLWFTPGYSGLNIVTLLFGCLSSISVIAYMGFIQPYLLTEVLKIPAEEPIKKAKKKKELDKTASPSLESFFIDKDKMLVQKMDEEDGVSLSSNEE